MDLIWPALGLLAIAAVLFATSRRAPAAAPVEPPEAVRRELARLIQELQAAVRGQVDRLDAEVRRVQAAVAEAERAIASLQDARSRSVLPVPPPPAPEPRPANPLHARVFELRDSGKDPADIGVETGLEAGEVELILGLRRLPPRA